MAKRNHPQITKPDRPVRRTEKPAVAKELADVFQSPGGTIQSQFDRLGDPQLQTAQRHALAFHIGRLGGNRALQRVAVAVNRNDGSNRARREATRAGSGAAVTTALQSALQLWSDPGALPEWSDSQLRAIQRQLRRLGLYRLRIDGVYGPGTQTGLVEAFGGEEWRRLEPDAIASRLSAAERPTGRRGEHRLRYGEMFKDGILDMMLGIGFDEAGHHEDTIERFQEVLSAHHFRDDRSAAVRIYRQAERTLGPSAFGTFFVRENALTYTPPAGSPRPVHAVVRLLHSTTGAEGGRASAAFREGMVHSDIAYYSGHGRYGSGPDFDRNMTFELLNAEGNVTQQIEDYRVLERTLREEGRRRGRSAWQQFLWRERRNRINVIGENAGNVLLNPTNQHSREFGSRLMYWNLRRHGGAGATPATGGEGELATEAEAHPERRYRLLVFDGCRTRDYVRSIRRTPGFGERSADILATRRSVAWGDEVATLAAFLESVLQQQSAEQIVRGIDAQQSPERRGGRRGGAYRGFGIGENPVVR